MKRPLLLREENSCVKHLSQLKSWSWVIAFVSISMVSFLHASKKKNEISEELHARINELSKVKRKIISENAELHQQLNSQSDPLWIEMTLMKGLGLVPEGQKKIHLEDPKKD